MTNPAHQKNGRVSDSRTSKKSKTSNDSGIISDLDSDFLPTKIIVYRNGDKFDPGTEVSVTRKEFKQWLTFLDGVTKKIRSLKAVKKLYTMNGEEVEDFKDLDQGNFYVASSDVFKDIEYGNVKPLKWTPTSKPAYHDPLGIDSVESLDIYMKKFGLAPEKGELANHHLDDGNLNFLKSGKRYGTIVVPQKLTFPHRPNANGAKAFRNPELTIQDKTVSLPKIYVSNYQSKSTSGDNDKNHFIHQYKSQRSFSAERIAQNIGTQTPDTGKRRNGWNDEYEYEYEIDYKNQDEDFYYNQPNVSYYRIDRNANEKNLKSSKQTFYG